MSLLCGGTFIPAVQECSLCCISAPQANNSERTGRSQVVLLHALILFYFWLRLPHTGAGVAMPKALHSHLSGPVINACQVDLCCRQVSDIGFLSLCSCSSERKVNNNQSASFYLSTNKFMLKKYNIVQVFFFSQVVFFFITHTNTKPFQQPGNWAFNLSTTGNDPLITVIGWWGSCVSGMEERRWHPDHCPLTVLRASSPRLLYPLRPLYPPGLGFPQAPLTTSQGGLLCFWMDGVTVMSGHKGWAI